MCACEKVANGDLPGFIEAAKAEVEFLKSLRAKRKGPAMADPVSMLRAMVMNYANGNRWDKLAAEVATSAADEIEHLRSALKPFADCVFTSGEIAKAIGQPRDQLGPISAFLSKAYRMDALELLSIGPYGRANYKTLPSLKDIGVYELSPPIKAPRFRFA